MCRECIVFQPVMNGIERIATPKQKVNGYSHSEKNGIHVFKRGNTKFLVDATKKEVAITKNINGKPELVSYEEFHKFITIQK